jgi:hypothetical protein
MNLKEYTEAKATPLRALMHGRQAVHVSARADYVKQRFEELTSEQGAQSAEAKRVISDELETTTRQVRALLAKPRRADAAAIFRGVALKHKTTPEALRGAARNSNIKNEAAYMAYMKGCTLRAIAIQLGGIAESAALRRVKIYEKTLKK